MADTDVEGLMVSVSGVRGRVGGALTPELLGGFAAQFGSWAMQASGRGTIVVGRDSRVSGPMFHRAVLASLQSVGVTVIDVGLAPTPTIQLAVEHHHAAGGLAITASHNPIEWNALKFIGPSGLFLSAEEGAAMRGAPTVRATWDRLGVVTGDDSAVARHIDAVLKLPYVDVGRISRRGFHVALDCCRGAGAVIMPALLERLGCRVTGINLEPDGRFPRPPEPIAENLGELEALVRESKADIGFAVDPDVDRLAVVDETGRAIGEDYTLALAVTAVLHHKKNGGPVVTNLSTSRVVADAAAAAGVELVRAPVGEVNVALKMKAVGASIGGEGNGGVILPDLHLGRDAPVGAALLLELLADDGRPLSKIVADRPRYAIVKDKLDRPAGPLAGVYDVLRTEFRDAGVDTQDGLWLGWDDRWVHIRPSGTEPIVRVIAEAPTVAEARALIARARRPLDQLSR
jgi:phosphomannomutase